MGPFETIDYSVQNAVAWVKLNRPDRLNCFNRKMREELKEIWRGLRHDDSVRAIVLTGAGERAFCTGIDRSETFSADGDAPKSTGYVHFDDVGEDLCPKTNDLWKPIVAAVNGMAAGGAFYMLGEADILIASEDATFFDPHVTYGMVASYETIHFGFRIPIGELLRMQLLGAHERMSAQRAREIGLVSEVCPAGELEARARWIAETIAARPAKSIQGTVYAAWATTEYPRSRALELGKLFLAQGNDPENLAEGQRFFASGQRVEWRKR